jgi:hypothetical protein
MIDFLGFLQLYFYCVTYAVNANYAYFDHMLVMFVWPLIMGKLLHFGYFTILHIQMHFQNFQENYHES